jgi:hypothetical protein
MLLMLRRGGLRGREGAIGRSARPSAHMRPIVDTAGSPGNGAVSLAPLSRCLVQEAAQWQGKVK